MAAQAEVIRMYAMPAALKMWCGRLARCRAGIPLLRTGSAHARERDAPRTAGGTPALRPAAALHGASRRRHLHSPNDGLRRLLFF